MRRLTLNNFDILDRGTLIEVFDKEGCAFWINKNDAPELIRFLQESIALNNESFHKE